MNRSIQVEGAFGVLKGDYEFQRFLNQERNLWYFFPILSICPNQITTNYQNQDKP